jgi:hypothetical protein
MSNSADEKSVSPFACDMTAIEASRRAQHMATINELFGAVTEIKELPDGYAFRLPGEPDVFTKTANFIMLERLCCPFFGFALEIEPEGGSTWLSLTGREGVKPFIVAEVGSHLGESVVKAAKFR